MPSFVRSFPGALLGAAVLLALLPARSPAVEAVAPDRIDALGLWLRAEDLAASHQDGDRILAWPDRSGKRFDAVYEERVPQAGLAFGVHRPPTWKARALGEHAAVSFDADRRESLLLNMAGHALGQRTSGFSAVFLVKPKLTYGPPPAPGAAWTKNRYLFLTHVSNYNSRMSVQIVEGSGEVKLFSRPVPAQKKVTQLSSFAGDERHAVTGDAWHRILVTLDYRAKVARIVLDGLVLERALPPESADVSEDVPSPITGIASTTLGDWLTCEIAEMACYDKALSVDELKGVDAYFCGKYGLKP
jgi:hypothetical protein